jgi:hypothetical protein
MLDSIAILKTGTFDFPDQRKLAVGDFKGYISCVDMETSKCIFQTKVHDGMINKIDGAGSQKFKQEINLGHGICHLEWKEKYLTDESIMASCMDGKLFEIANKEVKSIETGGTSTLWCVSRYEDHMAVGDGAGSLSIFKNNRKMETAVVSKKPLIAIDWNHEIPGLILTTSFEKHINILLLQHLK